MKLDTAETGIFMRSGRVASLGGRGRRRPPPTGDWALRVLEAMPDAVLVFDGSGRIVLVNRQAEALFGYAQADLIGQPLDVLIPERSHQAGREGLGSFLLDLPPPSAPSLEVWARRKDGSAVAVEVSLSRLQTEDEVFTIAIARDVSERRRSQDELDRQKSEFLSSISHDLRTPVTAIKASIGVVLANEPPDVPEPLHRMLVNIDLAADRLTTLVDDLLELTRLQAGLVRISRARCDLRALALRCARSIESLARSRGQRVIVRVPPEPVLAVVDAARVERALLNLLGNAHKYGREGGKIQLRLETRDREVVLSVADDGPGIAADEQQRIFERFYRADQATRQGTSGSGLGLPIARAMVELHGGRLWVESAPGDGSTFFIAIPTDRVETEDGTG